MKRFKRILAALTTAALTAGMCACGSQSTAAVSTETNSSKKILVTLADAQSGTRGDFEKAVRAAGKKAGFSMTVQQTAGVLNTQIKQLQNAKRHKFGGIICWADDPSAAKQLEIAADGLPIVFVNSLPEEDDLASGSFVYVGSDDTTAGQDQAEYVYNKLGKPDKINLLMMKGKKDADSTSTRTNAARNYLTDKGCDVNIVFSDFANDDQETAHTMMQSFATTGQTFDAAICNDDAMALGVVQYMQENGLSTSNIPVCGVDGTSDALTSIKSGGMSFTELQQTDKVAQACIDAISAIKSGGTINDIKGATDDGKYIWIPYKKVSKENVSEYQK